MSSRMSLSAARRTFEARFAGNSPTVSATSSADCELMILIKSRSVKALMSFSFVSEEKSSKKSAVWELGRLRNMNISFSGGRSSAASAMSMVGTFSKTFVKPALSLLSIKAESSSSEVFSTSMPESSSSGFSSLGAGSSESSFSIEWMFLSSSMVQILPSSVLG